MSTNGITQTIAGEPVDELLRALAQLRRESSTDGMMHLSGTMDPNTGATLKRALMRIEAELLLEEADEIRPHGAYPRTPEHRGADALVELARRLLRLRGDTAT